MWQSCIELNNISSNSSDNDDDGNNSNFKSDPNHNDKKLKNLNLKRANGVDGDLSDNEVEKKFLNNKTFVNNHRRSKDDCDLINLKQTIDLNLIRSQWSLLRQIINSKEAFKKQCHGKKYNWIQLAGHEGKFKPGEREGYILKLMDESERLCLKELSLDVLCNYVPLLGNIIELNCKKYTEMQDLLYGYQRPSIMDIKIGVRTFLEEDYMNEEKESKPRNDLYLRMFEISPEELTEKENEIKAITKRRFMSWREVSTSSSTLGFRIEAIKKRHVSVKEFFKVKEKIDIKSHINSFTDFNKETMKRYLERLVQLRVTLTQSVFFKTHEMIGSSLLFVHDNVSANIWIIDFGKTRCLPKNVQICHNEKWVDGNHEDGYLIGINSLINIFKECIDE